MFFPALAERSSGGRRSFGGARQPTTINAEHAELAGPPLLSLRILRLLRFLRCTSLGENQLDRASACPANRLAARSPSRNRKPSRKAILRRAGPRRPRRWRSARG